MVREARRSPSRALPIAVLAAALVAITTCHAASSPPAATRTLHWQALPNLPDREGFAGMFAGVSHGVLLAAGGANFPDKRPWEGGRKVWYDTVFALEPGASDWKVVGKLPRPSAYGVSITTDAGLLCVGGSDSQRHYTDCFLLQWQDGSIVSEEFPPLPQPCANACGVRIENRIYVAGGIASPGAIQTLKTFWMLDLENLSAGWQTLPSWPGPGRMLAVAGAQADSFFLFSGTDLVPSDAGTAKRRYLSDAYRYKPGEGWERLKDLPRPAVAAPSPALAVGQSHLVILGGDDGSKVDFRPLTEHLGFVHEALAYDAITDTWRVMETLPTAPVTAPTVGWQQGWAVISGEIRPGVRTPKVWSVAAEAHKARFGWINSLTLGVYLLAMVGIGAACSRRNKTTNDFFRGGQRMPWWAAGMSIFATMLSSITYMAIPATAYGSDWRLFLANSYILITPLVVLVYLPFYRRLNITSAYEYLERRFNLATRLVASALFILFQCGRIAIVLYLPALALATVSNFDLTTCILIMGVLCILYTVAGGIEAVIWTDVVQTLVLMGGALFSLVVIVTRLDVSLGELVRTASEHRKLFENVDWSWDLAAGTAWTILLGSVFHNLFAYTASQDVVQRYVTTPDQRTAGRAIWLNALISVPAQALFFAIGTALFVYYQRQPARLEPVFPTDAIFPLFIVRELPAGLAGLIVAGIFAAAQSTVSSSLNSVATACVTDFYRRLRPQAPDVVCLRLARLLTVIVGILGIGAALVVAAADLRSAFEAFLNVIGLFGGTISGLFVLGIFVPRATGRGAVAGALISAVTVLVLRQHVHFYTYAFIGIATTTIVGTLASLWNRPAPTQIEGLTLPFNKLNPLTRSLPS